mgnify:FL=1
MKKKTLSLILVLALCVSLLAGCGGPAASGNEETTPDGRTKITYTGYWCEADYEHDSYVEKYIEDALDIDIQVIKKETAETIDTMLAAGEMPDVMWDTNKTVDWMYEQELPRTIPRDLVEQYAPSFIKLYDEYPILYKQTLDPENDQEFKYLTGVTVQFTDYYLYNDYYRYDWIQKLGIDLGVNVEQVSDRLYVADDGIELSKFKEIMNAFITQDPDGDGVDDTIGATGGAGGSDLTYNVFLSAFGMNSVNCEQDGKVTEYYAREEYKDYLKGMNELWKAGLLDQEMILGNRNLSWDKVNKGISGYWFTSSNSLNSWAVDRPPLTLLDADPEAIILMTPGIKPDGGTVSSVVSETPHYGRCFINANVSDEKLISILKFLEFTIFGAGDRTVLATMFYGEEGVDWEFAADGSLTKLQDLASGKKGTWSFGQFGQGGEAAKWIGEEEMFSSGMHYWGKDGKWMEYASFPYKTDYTSETNYSKLNAEYKGDLDAYVADYRTRAIMGDIDVDATWEEYLAELDRLGYSELMAELDKVLPAAEIIASFE